MPSIFRPCRAHAKLFLQEFEKRYESWACKGIKQVEERLEAFPHKHLQFEFFFVPFKDVGTFREQFEKALRG